MNSAQPIKKTRDLEKFKNYYKEIKPNYRNELLIILGLNTALRISDMLSLEWHSVYDFDKKIVNIFKRLILFKKFVAKLIETVYE